MAGQETIPLNPDLTYRSKVTAQRQADAWNEVLGRSVINRAPATTVVVGPRTGGKYPLVWEVRGEQ